MIVISTARYFDRQKIVESGLAPIQTSCGAPRYSPGYEYAGAVGALMPYGLLKIADADEFNRLYVERLKRFGVKKIERVLKALAHVAGAPGVVLLCFEDLAKEGEMSCHRRVFAQWWEEQTGQQVIEL